MKGTAWCLGWCALVPLLAWLFRASADTVQVGPGAEYDTAGILWTTGVFFFTPGVLHAVAYSLAASRAAFREMGLWGVLAAATVATVVTVALAAPGNPWDLATYFSGLETWWIPVHFAVTWVVVLLRHRRVQRLSLGS